jgi:hypothetical protein
MRTIVSIGSFVVFVVLTVVMLKHHRNEIPRRDVYASLFLFAWSAVASAISAAIKRTTSDTTTKQQQKPPTKTSTETAQRPVEFTRTSNQLMQYEVLLTLLVPWIVLRASKWVQHNWQLPEGLVEHLLVPHLYFFQSQIAAEAILLATRQDALLFPYTCVANALRALPLATWILRSLVATQTMFHVYNPFHWVLVVLLPAAAAALWLYSSLIFIPLHWYPVLHDDERGRDKAIVY